MVPFLAGRVGHSQECAGPVSGLPTCTVCHPRLEAGVTGLKLVTQEPIMANISSNTGTTATIIYLPTAALRPVQQKRYAGRHPKMVTNLGRFKRDKEFQELVSGQRTQSVVEARDYVATLERLLNSGRYELMQAQQTAARVRAFQG